MKGRNKTLDGLRGLCALFVAFSHGMKFIDVGNIKNFEDITIFHPLGIQTIITKIFLALTNATGAVFIFFILSSYVLTLSLKKMPQSSHSLIPFYIKRFFRLVPTYVLSIVLISFFLYQFPMGNFSHISYFLSTTINFVTTAPTVISNLFLIQTNLNPISWTLQVEIIGSLLIPVLFFIYSKLSLWKNMLFFILLLGLSFFIHGSNPLHYLYVFYLGLFLFQSRGFFHFLQKNGYTFTFALLVIVFTFVLSRGIIIPSSSSISQLLEVFGSWLIVGLILYADFSLITLFFSTRIIQFYGKICYSFYLLHFMIFFILAQIVNNLIFHNILPSSPIEANVIITILSVLFGTIVAFFSYTFVEKPFISLSLKIVHSSKFQSVFNVEW